MGPYQDFIEGAGVKMIMGTMGNDADRGTNDIVEKGK